MKVTNGGTKTTTFTYGDTITVSGTIKASGTAPQANTLAAPGKNQAALFLGGTQLTDPVAVAGNGSFTISYKTSEKGIQTTGQAQILTVKYGGSDDLNEGSAACSITLNPKKVQAEVDGAITKPFDQTAKAHVTLKMCIRDSCDGDCANCPPHYGYRYGRWYYGKGHQYGCELSGNKGDGSL